MYFGANSVSPRGATLTQSRSCTQVIPCEPSLHFVWLNKMAEANRWVKVKAGFLGRTGEEGGKEEERSDQVVEWIGSYSHVCLSEHQ